MIGRRSRRLAAAASLVLCFVGSGVAIQGVAVPVRAELARSGLEREFAQRLEADGASHAVRVDSGTEKASPRTGPRERTTVARTLPASGPIARITVPRLGVREVVLAGQATPEHLARAPVMLKHGDSANPVAVVAAHRDTHFLFVRDLLEGDEVTVLFVTGARERYRVTRLETVRWDAFAYPLDPARPLLALVTCYPFGGTEYGGPLRRVAWAERVA